MRHGFIKVAAATPDIRVADVDYNKGQIIKQMDCLLYTSCMIVKVMCHIFIDENILA